MHYRFVVEGRTYDRTPNEELHFTIEVLAEDQNEAERKIDLIIDQAHKVESMELLKKKPEYPCECILCKL